MLRECRRSCWRMKPRSIVSVVVVTLVLAACGPRESPPDVDGAWVGTITTEGSVTTVINEAGSVWGGTARVIDVESAALPPILETSPGGATRRTIMQVPPYPRPVVVMSPVGAWVVGVGAKPRPELVMVRARRSRLPILLRPPAPRSQRPHLGTAQRTGHLLRRLLKGSRRRAVIARRAAEAVLEKSADLRGVRRRWSLPGPGGVSKQPRAVT